MTTVLCVVLLEWKAPMGDLSRHNVMGIGEGLELDIII